MPIPVIIRGEFEYYNLWPTSSWDLTLLRFYDWHRTGRKLRPSLGHGSSTFGVSCRVIRCNYLFLLLFIEILFLGEALIEMLRSVSLGFESSYVVTTLLHSWEHGAKYGRVLGPSSMQLITSQENCLKGNTAYIPKSSVVNHGLKRNI